MMEKTIENYLRLQVKKRGGLALKFTSPGYAGVPDRLVLMPGGMCYFVELKATGKKPTPLQQAMHARFALLGFPVAVIDSKEGVINWLKDL